MGLAGTVSAQRVPSRRTGIEAERESEAERVRTYRATSLRGRPVFRLRRQKHVDGFLEAFNVFDRTNFAIPSGRVAFTNAAGDVSPTFGRITSTTTTARQIQLGVKYLF